MAPSTKVEGLPHSERAPERAVVERAIAALRDVPGLVRLQKGDTLLSRVREALGGESEQGGQSKMSEGEAARYLLDDQRLVWYELEQRGIPVRRTSVLAVPRSLVADLLALVHCQHGHPGVGRTLALLRDRFHWPGMCRDARDYVLCCGCRRRKRSRSQRIAMLPARFLEPWEVLEVDLQRIPNTSEAGNEYLLLVVDKASRFLFAYPLPSKEALGVARLLLDLCLTFGVPSFIRADGGGEFTAPVMEHLCRWLKVKIDYGPADHPRGQGSVERVGAWILDVLSELCKAWPTRWDEYVALACWIKRTLPDPSLPSAMTPFQLLFGRSPRTSLDMLVPQMDDTEATEGLENFIEGRRHNLREVREALERMREAREKARQYHNAAIQRPSMGTRVAKGDLVLARESDSSLHRQGRGPKLVHEKWTGPWKVVEVVLEGLSVVIEMEGRAVRSRTVSTASLKPFYTRPSDLRHPMEDEFAQLAWGADLGLGEPSTTAAPMYTLLDRRRVVSATGVVRWEYRGRYLDGVASDWVSETESLDSFTPLQLDTFHALWNLYDPSSERSRPLAPDGGAKKRPALSRSEALRRFPIGTRVEKPLGDGGGGAARPGQVYDFYSPYWRVRFADNDWEELTATEMKRFRV